MIKQHAIFSLFRWESEVRDSELDIQGIVNNAVYFVYMEHCRHKHLKSLGLDFIDIHRQGIDLVVRDCALKFNGSLTTGDNFTVTSKLNLVNRVKVIIDQDIINKQDQKTVVTATFTVTGIDRKTSKLALPDQMIQLFQPE